MNTEKIIVLCDRRDCRHNTKTVDFPKCGRMFKFRIHIDKNGKCTSFGEIRICDR